MSFLLSSPNEKMYPRAGNELLPAEGNVHLIGESAAQENGISLLVKFPLFSGFSIPVHRAPAYRSVNRYLKQNNNICL